MWQHTLGFGVCSKDRSNMNIPTTYGGAILLACKEKYALVSK